MEWIGKRSDGTENVVSTRAGMCHNQSSFKVAA